MAIGNKRWHISDAPPAPLGAIKGQSYKGILMDDLVSGQTPGQLLDLLKSANGAVSAAKGRRVQAKAKISFPDYSDEKVQTKKLQELVESIVLDLMAKGDITFSETKDNTLEVVTVTATLNVLEQGADATAARLTREQAKTVRDEAMKGAKAAHVPMDAAKVKLLSDQIGDIVKSETRKAMTDFMAELEKLQAQILPETSGTFVANMLWFRLNALMEGKP